MRPRKKKPLCQKLTRAQREVVYAPLESNAGVGWGPVYFDASYSSPVKKIALRRRLHPPARKEA